MSINTYPSNIDRDFRIDFIRDAKEHVYWFTPCLSEEERSLINEIRDCLPAGVVVIHEYNDKNFNEKGYCFVLEDTKSCLDVELRTNVDGYTYDSLLVVDHVGCCYNHSSTEERNNLKFIHDINEVKLSLLKKVIENEHFVQISLLDSELFGNELLKNIIDNRDINDIPKVNELYNQIILTSDIEFSRIQQRICKVSINTPGIRTKDRHLDIGAVFDILGKPSEEIMDRLMLRWKIFGKDPNVDKEYKKLHEDFEKIKEKYTIVLNPQGRYILEKDKHLFEKEINKFRERLKIESINIIQQKINESKAILRKMITNIYYYTKNHDETLKACSKFELDSIIESIQANFPTVEDVIESSDVIYEYSSIERWEILNREFCRRLLHLVRNSDNELASVLQMSLMKNAI